MLLHQALLFTLECLDVAYKFFEQCDLQLPPAPPLPVLHALLHAFSPGQVDMAGRVCWGQQQAQPVLYGTLS